jgi:hypothetical protein
VGAAHCKGKSISRKGAKEKAKGAKVFQFFFAPWVKLCAFA